MTLPGGGGPPGTQSSDGMGGGFGPPHGKPLPNKFGGSPGLITSTGGLYGLIPLLISPVFNVDSQKNGFWLLDTTNFNTEEDCNYAFKQEEAQPLRAVTIRNILLTYRDLGKVKVTFTVVVYSTINDTYTSVPKTVILGGKNDGKLHSKKVPLVATGERPQLLINRKANAGALCLTKIVMVGTIAEEDQV